MSTTDSPSVRQIISDVRQDLNSVNLDDWIPAKYIHHKLLDTAKLFMKREADDRRFYLYPNIWFPITMEMEQSSLINCSDIAIPQCTSVMKSKLKLPGIYTTRYGYLMNVASLEYGIQYIPTTPLLYSKYKKSRYQNPKYKYFWINNGYIIIPDSFVEAVEVRAIFYNKAEAAKLDQCNNDKSNCKLMLDYEFTVPGHLLADVRKATVIELAQIRKAIIPSEWPHLNQLEKQNPAK